MAGTLSRGYGMSEVSRVGSISGRKRCASPALVEVIGGHLRNAVGLRRPGDFTSPERGAVAAVVVALLGFGILCAFHLVGLPHPRDLPGLFAFRSATIGDGFLLPLVAFSVVSAVGSLRSVSRKRRWMAAALSIAVAALAAWVQYTWLKNPDPAVNWTLPSAHTFTAAGWYHAGFFVAFSGFLAFYGLLAWMRLREFPVAAQQRPEVQLFGFAGGGFLGLWWLDSGASLPGCVVLIVAASTVYGLILVLAVPTTRWMLPCLAGVVPAVALCVMCNSSGTSLMAGLSVGCAVLVAIFCASQIGRPREASSRFLHRGFVMLCLVGPIAYINQFSENPLALLLGAVAATIGATAEIYVTTKVAYPRVAWKRIPRLAPTTSPVLVLPILATMLASVHFSSGLDYSDEIIRDAATVATYVAFPLVGFFGARALIGAVKPIIAVEMKKNADRRLLSSTKLQRFSAIAALFLAALAACVPLMMHSSAISMSGGVAEYQQTVVSGACVLVFVALAVLCTLRRAVVWLWVGSALSLVWGSYNCYLVAAQGMAGGLIQQVLCVCASIVVAVFVYESLTANMAKMELARVSPAVHMASVSAAFGVGSTVAWLIGPGVASDAGPTAFWLAILNLLVGAVAVLALPYITAAGLPAAHLAEFQVVGVPHTNVLQDGLVVAALVVTVSWIPVLLLVREQSPGPDWLVSHAAYISLLGPVFVFVMKTNLDHVHRDETRRREAAEALGCTTFDGKKDPGLVQMAEHIGRQNKIALAALFPLGILPLIQMYSGLEHSAVTELIRRQA